MNNFKICNKSIDYFKLIVYRQRKTIIRENEVFCPIVDKFIKDFNIDIPQDTKIFNIKGLGCNSGYNTKVLIDFRGEFLLRFGFEYIRNFIIWLKDNNFIFNITRLDIAIDYQNGDKLLPFYNRKSHFGKMTKGTILITEKFRGNLHRTSEWVQFRSTFIATFYDKTKEVLTSKNKEKRCLYGEIYTSGQIFRFELKLIHLKNFNFNTELSESAFIQQMLNEWYEKNKFSRRSKNIQTLFS